MTAPLVADSLYRFFHAGDAEVLALRGLSLTVQAGEVVAVAGPSGSGKSTLLHCLAGLDEPDGGMVHVTGARISRRPEAERARLRAHHVGVLFQQHNLLAHLSIAGNLELAQRLCGGPDRRRRDDLLDRCGIAHRADAAPPQLSGGEAARAGLAVALINDPAVLLADEPTGELDSTSAARVMEMIRAHAREGGAVVLVTHNPELATRADRSIELRDGQVVA